MTVAKFGGSSVASAAQIKKVKDILDSDKNRKIIIVSAPGKRNKDDEKVTDMLYKCNALVQKGQSCKSEFAKIQERFISIAQELSLDIKSLSLELDEIRYQIDAGKGADFTASRGEYLSAYLISQYLGWEFVDAKDAVIINDDGTVNPFSYDRIRMMTSGGGRYVFPGFYGADRSGIIKTFSRGGSDITGSVVSRSVNADMYENWTDVSGMYSSDPRIIKDAKVIDVLTYEEARELSDLGASVFHEEAIAPLIDVEIPVNIRNTNSPDDFGTLIVPATGEKKLAGVSVKHDLSSIEVRRLMLFKQHTTRHQLMTHLHLFGIRPCYSIYGIDSVVWFFNSADASDGILEAMCERLKSQFSLDYVKVERNIAILGLVGSNLMDTSDYLKAASALENDSIKLSFMNYGASDVSVTYGIKEEESNRALEIVYDTLFR